MKSFIKKGMALATNWKAIYLHSECTSHNFHYKDVLLYTSAKEVMIFPALDRSVCLFVCLLLATLCKKSYEQISMKFSGNVRNGSMKK